MNMGIVLRMLTISDTTKVRTSDGEGPKNCTQATRTFECLAAILTMPVAHHMTCYWHTFNVVI